MRSSLGVEGTVLGVKLGAAGSELWVRWKGGLEAPVDTAGGVSAAPGAEQLRRDIDARKCEAAALAAQWWVIRQGDAAGTRLGVPVVGWHAVQASSMLRCDPASPARLPRPAGKRIAQNRRAKQQRQPKRRPRRRRRRSRQGKSRQRADKQQRQQRERQADPPVPHQARLLLAATPSAPVASLL